MKNILIAVSFLVLLPSETLFAQNSHFITEGSIEYDKSINMYAVLGKKITQESPGIFIQAVDQYKKTQPQFLVQKSILSFSKGKTLFRPVATSAARLQ
jgi:hypothetical protein